MRLIGTTAGTWVRILPLVVAVGMVAAALEVLGTSLQVMTHRPLAVALVSAAWAAFALGVAGWLVAGRSRLPPILCLPAVPVTVWAIPALFLADAPGTEVAQHALAYSGWSAAVGCLLGSFEAALYTRAVVATRRGEGHDFPGLLGRATRDLPWVLWPFGAASILTQVGLQWVVPGIAVAWLLLMVGPAATLDHRSSAWRAALRATVRDPSRALLVLVSFPVLALLPHSLVLLALEGGTGLAQALIVPGSIGGSTAALATAASTVCGALWSIAIAALYLDITEPPPTSGGLPAEARRPASDNPFSAPAG